MATDTPAGPNASTPAQGGRPPAGWYPDPEFPAQERYWAGASWSQKRRTVQQPRTSHSASSDNYWKYSLLEIAQKQEQHLAKISSYVTVIGILLFLFAVMVLLGSCSLISQYS